MPHFDRINISLQCLHFPKKIPTVTVKCTRDFAILQSGGHMERAKVGYLTIHEISRESKGVIIE